MLCRIEIIPDYTGVGLGSFRCIWYGQRFPFILHQLASMSAYRKVQKILLPQLEKCLKNYCNIQKPLYKRVTFSEVEYHSNIFSRKEGFYYQNCMIELSEKVVNWAATIWVNHCFFENRQSLLYTNETRQSVGKFNWSTSSQMLTVISEYISNLLRFWEDIKHHRIQQDYIGEMPLCMDQYKRIMGTHRKCLPKKDNWRITKYSKHIIVMHGGRMFEMRVYDEKGNYLLSREEIFDGLSQIMSHPTGDSYAGGGAIGTVTALDRDNWYCIREEMKRSKLNIKSLRSVEECLFGLCLDEPPSKNKENVMNQTAYGDHREDFKNFNRWFDLGLQCVISKDGHFTWITEQSIFDGSIILQPNQTHVIEGAADNSMETSKTPVKLIKWDLSENTITNIERGKKVLIDLSAKTDPYLYEFTGFGQNFLGKHRFLSNGLVQQAIILAYFQLYNRLDHMVQPISLRHYREGRMEHPRIVTCESKSFVEAITSKVLDEEEILELMEKAIDKHNQLIADVSHLNHYVKNIFGLKWFIELEHFSCDFLLVRYWDYFANPRVIIVNSTTREPILTAGIPTYGSGHYIYFHPMENSILFSINTLLKPREFKSSKSFVKTLEKSLMSIKQLIESQSHTRL